MEIFAETDRLILREIVASDVGDFFEMERQPAVHTYLFSEAANNKDQIMEGINFIRNQYKENGIGRWAVIEKASSKFVGWSGMKLVTTPTNNFTNFHDIGYRLHPNSWGKGYATESAMAAIEYAKHTMKLDSIYGITDKNNIASKTVLEKVGLVFQNEFIENDTALLWYSLKL